MARPKRGSHWFPRWLRRKADHQEDIDIEAHQSASAPLNVANQQLSATTSDPSASSTFSATTPVAVNLPAVSHALAPSDPPSPRPTPITTHNLIPPTARPHPLVHPPPSTVPSSATQGSIFTGQQSNIGTTQPSTLESHGHTPTFLSERYHHHSATGYRYRLPDLVRDKEHSETYSKVRLHLSKGLQAEFEKTRSTSSTFFMIELLIAGPESHPLRPHIFISCESQEALSVVERYCRQCQWLREECAGEIIIKAFLIQDVRSGVRLDSNTTRRTGSRSLGPIQRSGGQLIMSGGSQYPYGLLMQRGSGDSLSSCRLGGFFWKGHKLYGLGPGHFMDGWDEEHTGELDRSLNKFREMPTAFLSAKYLKQRLEVNLIRKPQDPVLRDQDQIFDYDWLLVDISNVLPELFTQGIEHSGTQVRGQISLSELADRATTVSNADINVTILMGEEPAYQGCLNTTPTTISIGRRLLDVRMITLKQRLPVGSSGAWVIYEELVCGFVVAVCDEPICAYMIPISKAFEEVERCFGQEVRVATPEDLAPIIDMSPPHPVARPTSSSTLRSSADSFKTLPVQDLSTDQRDSRVPAALPLRPLSDASDKRRGLRTLRKLKQRICEKLLDKSGNRNICAHDDFRPRRSRSAFNCRKLQESNLLSVDEGPRLAFGCTGSQSSIPEVRRLVLADEITAKGAYSASLPASKLPRQITINLALSFEGQTTKEKKVVQRRWLEHWRTFRELQGIAELQLRATNTLTAGQAYIRSGNCSLFYGDLVPQLQLQHNSRLSPSTYALPFRRTFDCRTVENAHEWSLNIPEMVHEFCTIYQDAAFYLEVAWEIGHLNLIQIQPKDATTLVRMLLSSNRKFNWDNRAYVSEKALRTIMSSESMWKIIKGTSSLCDGLTKDAPLERIIDFFWCHGWRLMAIVVDAGLPLEILASFFRIGYSDRNLPLSKAQRPEDVSEEHYEKFLIRQYTFIPHTFDLGLKSSCHTVIPEEIVVPVKFHDNAGNSDDQTLKEVFKVTIDSEHYRFGLKHMPLAIKRLNRHGDHKDIFRREREILKTLGSINHQHVLVPLASWQQGNTISMLLPCATSDLNSFLRKTPQPNLARDLALEIIKSLKGIADALCFLHNLGPSGLAPIEWTEPETIPPMHLRQGFHHDIKPSNILVFDARGGCFPELKLGDFGFTRISQVFAGVQETPGTRLSTDRRQPYGAPDHQLGQTPAQPYDIWSLGCVFSEVMTWMCSIEPQVADFEQARLQWDGLGTFWYEADDGPARKPVVLQQLSSLRTYSETRGALLDLESLVAQMLAICPAERPDAPNVVSSLKTILYQANLDLAEGDFYITGGLSRCKVAAPSPRSHDSVAHSSSPHLSYTIPQPQSTSSHPQPCKTPDLISAPSDLDDLDLDRMDPVDAFRTRAVMEPSTPVPWNSSDFPVTAEEIAKLPSDRPAPRTRPWASQPHKAAHVPDESPVVAESENHEHYDDHADDDRESSLAGPLGPPRDSTFTASQSSDQTESKADTDATELDIGCQCP